ncbi:MAG TPA: signal peptide peptidase SppA [Croceibacterium sp.]|jgi:protease-4
MSFAGKVWRLLVGIKDGLALVVLLLFFWVLFEALSARPNPGAVHKGALLLDLDGQVVEEPARINPLQAVLSSAAPTHQYAARDVIRSIDAAARDDRIKAIALDLSTFIGGGQVHDEEIGEALDRFRRTGKPVLTYAIAYTDASMLLAAHSSEVWVDPEGGAALSGPGGTNLYYAGLIDKLKIKAHVFRVGTYKSAVEPYMLDKMSDAARENYTALYGSLWQEWQANVKQARPRANLTLAVEHIGDWIAGSNGDLARASLQAGLVDKIGTKEQWGDRVAQIAGKDDWDKKPGSFASTELKPWLAEVNSEQSRSGKPIGVITIAGDISDGDAGPGEAGAQRITRLLDNALEDDHLAALVVRVDSPGGTVSGSESIRRAILRQKARGIPIVVSMGDLAASGGYWVSTTGDQIFAEPETITGSIGIFGVVPTFEDTLAKFGITSDGVRTTPLSGQPDVLGGLSPETELLLQKSIDFGYQEFLTRVSQSRHLPVARVDQIGQGRVWDGGSARQLGLVDRFGDLDDALAYAAARAKLGKGRWYAKFLTDKPSRWEVTLAALLGGNDEDRASTEPHDMIGYFAARQSAVGDRVLADLDRLMGVRGMEALCLECESSMPAPPPSAGEASAKLGWLATLARLFD